MTNLIEIQKIRFGEDSSGDALYFNGSVNPTRQVATRKQLVGKTLVEKPIPMASVMEWRLAIQGILEGTTSTIDTVETDLKNMEGEGYYPYSDDESSHSGSYILVPTALKFDTNPNIPKKYGIRKFNMELVQYTQTPL